MPADSVARRLQADYIARNPNPIGEKNKLLAAPGGSRYDAVHARYHPVLKRAAETVGFYDINLLACIAILRLPPENSGASLRQEFETVCLDSFIFEQALKQTI